MSMPKITFAVIGLFLISAAPPGPSRVENVAAWERISFEDGPTIIAASIVEDSRCYSQDLCFDDDRLIVGVIVFEEGQWHDVLAPLGADIPLRSGSLKLTSTATPPSNSGAIPLGDYRLNFEFSPKSR